MTESSENTLPTPKRRLGSKAGRNKGRELVATFLNNVAVGFFLAAVLQPLLAVMRDGRPIDMAAIVSTFLLGFVSAMCVWIAQAIARRLED